MAVQYNPGIVTDGLVLYLDAANRKSYPGTGITMTDISATGLACSLINSPTFSNDSGGIFNLNGTDEYFTILDNEIFNFGASNFTIEIAIKFNELTLGRTFWAQSNGSAYAPFLIFKNANHISFWASSNGTSWDVLASSMQISSSYLSTANWAFVTVTRSGTTWKSYFNGQNISSTTASGTLYNATEVLQIGSRSSISEYLSGSFAFNRIYNRSLSDQEIQQNFNALRGRFGI